MSAAPICLEVAEIDGTLFAARVKDGTVIDLSAQRSDDRLVAGTVVVGRVTKRLPNNMGALVDIGRGRAAPLMKAGDAREGGLIAVQLLADRQAMREGKLPALSRDIALPGRFVLFRPGSDDGLRFSRRLAKADHPTWEEAFADLAQGGLLVRAGASAGDTRAALTEVARLATLALTLAPVQAAKVGAVLLDGPTAWQRAIIDEPSPEMIRSPAGPLATAIKDWLAKAAPDLQLRFHQAEAENLMRLLDDVDQLVTTCLALDGGGTVWIEQTRALTAVDIDAPLGASRRQVNESAATVIAEQIRLRNLSGQFAIDFLRVGDAAERRRLLNLLQASLQADAPAGAAHLHFDRDLSPVGPYLFSRERRGSPLGAVIDDTDG
ncbi:MAG: ribonuclease E/G [Pseudomonadota bacterium]